MSYKSLVEADFLALGHCLCVNHSPPGPPGGAIHDKGGFH